MDSNWQRYVMVSREQGVPLTQCKSRLKHPRFNCLQTPYNHNKYEGLIRWLNLRSRNNKNNRKHYNKIAFSLI